MKLMRQFLVLGFSFLFVFIWQNTALSNYAIPLIGLLVFIYIMLSVRKKGEGFFTMGGDGGTGIFILNTVILLLIFSTGGIDSNLFFILYFLIFGIAFVFEPVTVFVFIVCVVLVFLPAALKDDVLGNFIKLFALGLISPLAFFFGMEYRKREQEEEKTVAIEERTKEAADTIAKDVEEVIKDEKGSFKHEDVERLNDILEETEELREETRR